MSRMISSIPIAIKSSKRVAKWFTITLDDNNPPQTYVKLHHKNKPNRLYILNGLLSGLIYWNLLVLCVIYTSYLLNTYTYLVLRPETLVNVPFYIALLADLIFICDIGLNITQALVFHNGEFANRFVIILDILLVFPFCYVYWWFVEINWIFIALRFICVLRLYKIVEFISQERLKRNSNLILLVVIETFVYGFAVLHGSACTWYCLACPFTSQTCNGWSVLFDSLDLELDGLMQWYLLSFYYSSMVNLNYGYSLIVVNLEKLGVVTGMVVIFLLLIYLTSNLFLLFVLMNRRRMQRYLHLKYLKERCERLHYDSTGLTKIFRLEWSNKRGVYEARLSNVLPPSILADALFDINLPALKSTLVFRNGGDSYLRRLSSAMRHEFLNEGDFIYRQDEEKNKMVVITAGLVDVMSEEDDTSPIITFGPGTCLGESSMVYTLKSRSSVRAGKFVEIQSLHREDFYTTIFHYPKQYVKVHRTIRSRTQEAVIKRMNAFTFTRTTSIKKIKNVIVPEKGSLFSLYRTHHPAKISNFIPTDSNLYFSWEILIVVFALIVAIAYPYYVGFVRRFPSWFVLPSVLIEITFVADAFLKLITVGANKEQKMRAKDVVSEKFNTISFYLDVFSAFYFEFFCYLLKDSDRFYYIFKLNRLVKLYKLPPLLSKFEGRFTYGIVFMRCVRYVVLFGVFTFWASVVGYMLACFAEVCCPNGWFKLKIVQEKEIGTEVPMFRDRLLLSFFYTLSHVSTFELHEMHLRAVKDLVFVGFAVFIGFLFISVTIADVSSLSFLNHKYRFAFLKDLECLDEFCESAEVPTRLKTRLLNYYQLQWDCDRCCSLNSSKLTSQRDEDLLVLEVLECLRNVILFAGMDESFVRAVAVRSKVYVLPPADIVTYFGSMNKEMFVIKEGYCVYKNSGGFYRRIGPNSAFGMCTLFFNLTETMLVRTLTHCKLISVDGSALQEALNLHPEVNRLIKEVHREIAYSTFVGDSVSMPDFNYQETRSKVVSNFGLAWKKKFSQGGFINVMRFCRKYKERYMDAFNNAETFFFLKFILVPMTLLPDGPFLTFWIIVRLTTAFLYGILSPIQQIASPYHVHLHRFLTFLDATSFVDLYVMLHACYYEERGTLVVHPLKTAGNYVRRSFCVDFFLSFPYELFLKFMPENHNEGHSVRMHEINRHSFHCMLRLVRTLHVYKVFSAFRYWEGDVRRKSISLHLCKHILSSVFFINAFACFLIYNTCQYISAQDYEYLKRSEFNFYKRNASGLYCRAQSWLDRSNYTNFIDFIDVYTTAFYWTANIMSGLNFGDLRVQGGIEMIIAACVQLFGLFYISYLVFTLLPHCLHTNVEIINYKRNMSELNAVMLREGVDLELRKKVERNAVYTWRRTHDINTTKLFSCLHTTLLQDCLSFMYEDTLSQVPLFSTIDRSFLRILGMMLKPQYFLEGQVIVEQDDIIDEFYIVHRGTVSVELTRSTVKYDLIRGSLFGYYYNESVPNMTITATAISNVDVLCVRTVDYHNILRNYSKFHGKIKDVVSEYKDFMPSKAQDKDAMSIIIWEKQRNQGKFKRKFSVERFIPLIYSIEFLVLFAAYTSCIIRSSTFVFQTNSFFYWNIAIEVIFVYQLVMNFFTPYYDQFGDLVTNRMMIRHNYVKNTKIVILDFALTIIACGSFSMFHPYLQFDGWFYCYTAINLITNARVIHILNFFKKRWNDLNSSQTGLSLLSAFIWTSLCLHALTNIWILVECFENKCNEKQHVEEFIDALYFVINVLTRTGLCEVELRSNVEKVFVVMVLILCKFLFVILLGSLINTLWISLKFSFAFRYRLQELQDYFTCASVDKYQINKMVEYLKRFWCLDRGQKLPELLSKLPLPISNEVRIAINKPLLSKSYLFSGTENHFLDNIALLVEHTVYYKNDFIVHDGQIDETMYFIKTGEVEILTINSNHVETVHDVLHDGEMFGLDQGLFSSTPHQYTIRARTRCEILNLQLGKWDHLLDVYYQSKDLIYKRIRNLHMQLNK